MSDYTPEQYVTLQDALENLGWTADQINTMSAQERSRYQDWVREGNNLVETTLFKVGNDTPLTANSKEFTYAKSAALNWVVYKKRDKEGSKNSKNAKDDHEKDLDMIIELLTATRTDRTETASIIGTNHSLDQITLPSQIDTFFY